FWLILVFMLLAQAAPTSVRAQDDPGVPPGPDASSAAPSDLPLPRPLDLPPTDDARPPMEPQKPDPEGTPPRKEEVGKKAPEKKKPQPQAQPRAPNGGPAKGGRAARRPALSLPRPDRPPPRPASRRGDGGCRDPPGK